MCAAKMAGLKNGSNQHRKEGVQNCTPSHTDTLASEEAGKVFGISRRQVFHALRVLREGCNKLIEQCETGVVSVSLACCPSWLGVSRAVGWGKNPILADILSARILLAGLQ